jgi:hypothetical protein
MLCNFLRNREKIADSLSILSTGILLINSLCLRYLSFLYDEKKLWDFNILYLRPQNI